MTCGDLTTSGTFSTSAARFVRARRDGDARNEVFCSRHVGVAPIADRPILSGVTSAEHQRDA